MKTSQLATAPRTAYLNDHLAKLNQGWEEVRDRGISKLEDYLTNGDKI
jgi:flagellar motor component MotA